MRGLFFIPALVMLTACQQASETVQAPSVNVDVPTPPATRNLPAGSIEDIDFNDYSQDLARAFDLKMGESRLDSIDKIRLYFAPTKGGHIVNTTSSTFERDDGSVMIFASSGLQDDSVKAEEVYVVFSGTGGADKFNQSLAAYGMRIKCYRGENTTEWQTNLCP